MLKVACGRNADQLKGFAQKWGWEETETDWKKVIDRKDIDIVDVSTPTFLHHDMVIAASEGGQAHLLREADGAELRRVEGDVRGCEEEPGKHYINFNYRRCPAIVLAKQIVDEGKIGRIYHWRGCYLQSWIMDPAFPLTWHLQKQFAGSGPQGDLELPQRGPRPLPGRRHQEGHGHDRELHHRAAAAR